ncbi:hypothetical protein HRG_010263 [Hirsutella rhossiliensis]|uniref:Uncharacterized protein n=1 Tax=Hirsutella rhossiliensis TaxID=111463 RepID=A0A9P8SDG8_9HYPO|nr:uncharacterized protein HRG_10263 [Hirsutella rhossiliensis]KAH0958576.1 hypothetical protein HRG_10263 [Hirsutella rhossiliensis]
MFLHSGAGLHGHEYSDRSPSSAQSPPPPPPTRPRYPLLRTALRPLAPSEPSPSPRPLSHQELPSRRSSFAPDDYPRLSSLSSSRRSASGSLVKKDLAVRFREPQMEQAQTPIPSEDESSVVGSEPGDSANGSTRRIRRKRVPRKMTRFALAHPAPQLRTKQRRLVQIRPRLLLQLQEVGDRRAIPAFDVVPSGLVAGSLIIPRLAKRFPRMFRVKPELGQDDVLVVRSDDYGPPTPTPSPSHPDGTVHDQDVLAVISAIPQRGSSCAEIALEDGSTWLASPMANGSFEFTSVDDYGITTTARWARRSLLSTRNSSASIGPPNTPPLEQAPGFKWTFSVIDPSSRRHPIMGSLTPDSLEVYDSYTTLSTSSRRYPPSRTIAPDSLDQRDAASPSVPRQDERTTVAVAQGLKNLMLATATWVSLHQRGWPASANPKLARSTSYGRSGVPGMVGRRQTFAGFEGVGPCPEELAAGLGGEDSGPAG